jgi:creatinine amidohydrolase
VRVRDLNWMQLEAFLEQDDRIVLPLGSTEQHAYLSLETDNILSERVASEAAEPLGVPVLPVLAYGLTPSFAAYPGSLSLRIETYVRVLAELLDSLYEQGFRRILIVNGHGGNGPARSRVVEWSGGHGDAQVIWHDWWSSPEVGALADSFDPVWSHASWSENFPWTRLDGVELPAEAKERVPLPLPLEPTAARRVVGDGSFGGRYARPDEEVLELWRAGVEGVRALLESGWDTVSSSRRNREK